MLEKIKKYDFKNALLGILAIVAYFLLNSIQLLPFKLAGVDINQLSTTIKIAYLLIYELLMMAIIILIFSKKIKRDFNDLLKNHKEYYSEYMKFWLIGLGVMLVSNSFIIFGLGNEIAENENAVRSLFKISPLYIYLSSVIFAPVVEELVFRQGIRNILGRNIVFIIVSGMLFGGLHVVTSMTSPIDILYIIPYSSLGIAFAYMLYKTDNIFVSMGFHFLHNGLLIALQFLTLFFS